MFESEIDEDVNEPLKEERGLKIDSRITEADITGLAENMGISLEGKAGQKYTVKHHRFNQKKQEELRIFMEQQKQVPVEKKPWWKFWWIKTFRSEANSIR
ncbi:MAG: hypothetical protein EOO88_01200 [Pedobacter sp.]|nr:MAG: hypothetical protein EOO88_01200 [Pedobacter sp.]